MASCSPRPRRSRQIGDAVIGFIGIPLALWMYLVAPQEAKGLYESDIQPWFFPRIVLLVFAGLCLLLVVTALWPRDHNPTGADSASTGDEEQAVDRTTWLCNCVVPPALTLLYIVLIQLLGFMLSTFLVTATYMLFLNARVLTSLVAAALLAGSLYYLFGVFLHIPLPVGRFFS